MPVLTPLMYRLHLLRDILFGDQEIIGEVLVCEQNKLSDKQVQVSWTRDGEYIVGTIHMDDQTFFTQGRSAKEFVEMVNDAIYAVYDVEPKYAKQLGHYRLVPSKDEFEKLNNSAIKKSAFNFGESFGNAATVV